VHVALTVQEREATLAAIVRLKFDGTGEVPDPYFGSPFVADAASKMLQAVIDESDRIGDRGRAAGWRRWARWSSRGAEPPIVIRHAASSAPRDTWTRAERVFYLTTCTAPFILSKADVEALLGAIDAERRPTTA
jgi:hypothetical protein